MRLWPLPRRYRRFAGALALQREKPDFISQQQIGLATGQVFACAVGSTNRREYTTVGQVVNMSARLAQVCPPGAVLTDEPTSLRVKQTIRFQPLHQLRFKGKETPVTAYQVVDTPSSLPVQPHLTVTYSPNQAYHNREFYVREQELLTLQERLDAALVGNGGLVGLADVSGTDTAELVALAVQYWQERGGVIIPGVGETHMSDTLLGLWQPVWRHFFGLRADMTALQQANQVVAQTRRDCPIFADRVGLWGGVLDLPIAKAEAFLQISPRWRTGNRFLIWYEPVLSALLHASPPSSSCKTSTGPINSASICSTTWPNI